MHTTAARILTRTKTYDHISPFLNNLYLLTLKYRIDVKILILAYKHLNGLASPYLSELLEVYTLARGLRSGDSLKLKVPRTHLKTYGDKSFAHAAPILWNIVTAEINAASSLDAFKSKLQTYLFHQ